MAAHIDDDEPLVLHDFFARTVKRWPERIAIDIPRGRDRFERQALSYAALDAMARGLAHRVAGRLGGEERIVALLLPRTTPHLFVVLLGVLMAGGAYTCLDPGFPDARMREIVADAEAVAILTDAAGAARLRKLDLPDDMV